MVCHDRGKNQGGINVAVNKPKNITIEIGGDNTGLMKSLNEIEEKIDRIMEKANRLIETLNECHISADKD